nr:undecaprenyl-diphosphate phosphatase [Neochlamydia sp. AcF95]
MDCGSKCRGFESRRSPFFTSQIAAVSTIEAIFLGFIQGITEFLPVSSSGHLILAQYLLGMRNFKDLIAFDLICHLGTLLALFIAFFKKIKTLLTSEKKVLYLLFIALLPLFPLVFFLKFIKAFFDHIEYLGYFFLFTAALMYLGIRFSKETSSVTEMSKHTWKEALTIGFFQAMAVFPGISRSGATISAARLLGWNYEHAITFSFLLAIPTLMASIIIELGQLILKRNEYILPAISWVQYLAGFFFSFLFGIIALHYLQKLASKRLFMYFIGYCLLVGMVTTLFFRNL